MTPISAATNNVRRIVLENLSVDMPKEFYNKAKAAGDLLKLHGDQFSAAAAKHAANPAKRDLFGTAVELMKTFFTKFGMSEERYLKLADQARSFVSTLLKIPGDFSKQELDAANKSFAKDVKDGLGRMSQYLKTYVEKAAAQAPEAATKA